MWASVVFRLEINILYLNIFFYMIAPKFSFIRNIACLDRINVWHGASFSTDLTLSTGQLFKQLDETSYPAAVLSPPPCASERNDQHGSSCSLTVRDQIYASPALRDAARSHERTGASVSDDAFGGASCSDQSIHVANATTKATTPSPQSCIENRADREQRRSGPSCTRQDHI
jgi:hypothetical protein